MPLIQTVTAVIGFLLTCIVILLYVLILPPASYLTAANSLSFIFSSYFLLFVITYVCARILKFATAAVPFYIVSLLYVLLMVALLIVSLILLGTFWPVLLVGLVILAPLFLMHWVVVFIGYVAAASLASGSNVPTGGELAARGFLMGVNAGVNFLLAAGVYGFIFVAFLLSFPLPLGPLHALLAAIGVVLGVILALVILIVEILIIVTPSSSITKVLAGWLTPLMPTAWITQSIGTLVFFLNLLGHLFSFIPPLRVFLTVFSVNCRNDTSTAISLGGICANLNPIKTAYNLGTFVLMSVFPAPSTRPYFSVHETGHHLSLAAFGTHFHFIGFGDEMVKSVTPGDGTLAYAERLAESNVTPDIYVNTGVSPRSQINMW